MKKELKDLESAIRSVETDAAPAEQKKNILARAAMTAQEEAKPIKAKKSALWTWVPVGAACAVVIAAAAVFLPRITANGSVRSDAEINVEEADIELAKKTAGGSKYDTSSGEPTPTAATTTTAAMTDWEACDTSIAATWATTFPMTKAAEMEDMPRTTWAERDPSGTEFATTAWVDGEPDGTEFTGTTWVEPTDIWTEPTIIQPRAGLLTAGEWSDSDHLEFWRDVLNRNDWYTYQELYGLFLGERVGVVVNDADGKPVQNARAVLTYGGKTVYSAVTDVNGRAYLYTMGQKTDLNGDVDFTSVAESAAEFTAFTSGDTAVTITADPAAAVQYLDLAFLIDTTGSMGDEIQYLQEELKDVISTVSKSQPNLTVRISFSFYRDEGDDYVVRTNDFTTDVDRAIHTLAVETADGGGDYPEAVDQAMAAALEKLSWEENSVKLLYFVLDAPAHSDDAAVVARLQKLIPAYADKGIRVVPIASSGVDTETEFFLRDLATFTDGTYVFLTDDSGVSVGGHLEPTIGEYTVRPLNELLVEITNRYCDGWDRDAEPTEPTQPVQTSYQQ